MSQKFLPMDSSYHFKCLERHELNECAEMVSKIFSLYDPFISELKFSPQEFCNLVKKDLEKIVDDQLVIICKTKANKIIGCFAGIKWSNPNIEKKNNDVSLIVYHKLKNIKTNEEKDLPK